MVVVVVDVVLLVVRMLVDGFGKCGLAKRNCAQMLKRLQMGRFCLLSARKQ